jgi:hypothetical protein
MAYTDREDSNYLGELFLIGANQTPFLNMIGGMGNGKTSKSFKFPVAQPWALSSASQDTQSEATAAATQTETTITRAQDYNVCQIMKEDVGVSFAKQSTTGEFAGIQVMGDQPVEDEFEFQKEGQLRQIAINVEYSYLNGTFTDSSVATTNQQTRGAITATTTNAVNAASATLTKALVDQLMRTMAGNGSVFRQPVIFCNAFQKQKLSDIYGYAPTDRTIGGVNIQTIWTDFAEVGVVYAPQVPAATLWLGDVAVCSPVFVPHEGNAVSFTDIGIVAAKRSGFWYLQTGIDYGPEEYHGKITSLATS